MRSALFPRFLAALLGLLLLSVVLPRTLFHHCEHALDATTHEHATLHADTHCAVCDMVVSVFAEAVAEPVQERTAYAAVPSVGTPALLMLGHVDRLTARGPPARV